MEMERKIQGDVQKQKLNLENSSAELEFVTSGKSTEMKIDLRKFAVRVVSAGYGARGCVFR